jgi:hypothetical protein
LRHPILGFVGLLIAACGRVSTDEPVDASSASASDAGSDSDAATPCELRPSQSCTGSLESALTDAIRRCGACLAFSIRLTNGCMTKIQYGTDAGLVDFTDTNTCVFETLRTSRYACAPQGETTADVPGTSCGP